MPSSCDRSPIPIRNGCSGSRRSTRKRRFRWRPCSALISWLEGPGDLVPAPCRVRPVRRTCDRRRRGDSRANRDRVGGLLGTQRRAARAWTRACGGRAGHAAGVVRLLRDRLGGDARQDRKVRRRRWTSGHHRRRPAARISTSAPLAGVAGIRAARRALPTGRFVVEPPSGNQIQLLNVVGKLKVRRHDRAGASGARNDWRPHRSGPRHTQAIG